MDNQENQSVENLLMDINAVTPTPKPDTQSITQLVRHSGRIGGYRLPSGQIISKEQGIELTKAGVIRGVAVATGNGSEYLRFLPDGEEGNNLGNLLSIPQRSFYIVPSDFTSK